MENERSDDDIKKLICRWAEEAMYWRDNSERWQKIAEDAADGLRKQVELEQNLMTLLAQCNVPEHMYGGVIRYVLYGILPGSFLSAIFANDFFRACSYADSTNLASLASYARLLNVVPTSCWGSSRKVLQWHKKGGLEGTLDRDNKGARNES